MCVFMDYESTKSCCLTGFYSAFVYIYAVCVCVFVQSKQISIKEGGCYAARVPGCNVC